jgi:uncharacterized protein DUF1843
MAQLGTEGNGILLYGVTLRNKIKSADLDTLKAYQTVAKDLLASGGDGDDGELKASLADLDSAIAAKQSKP